MTREPKSRAESERPQLTKGEVEAFLKRYEPSAENPICCCGGDHECVYHHASRIIRSACSPASIEAMCNAVIEECAKIAEEGWTPVGIATSIRDLQSSPSRTLKSER